MDDDEPQRQLKCPQPFAKTIQGFYDTQTLTDFTITCGPSEWKVHKVWICAHSGYFVAIFRSDFKEAQSNTIALNDDDPELIGTMINYFYTFDYSDASGGPEIGDKILFHARMFKIANKYLASELEDLALKKFTCSSQTGWHTDEFANAIAELYEASNGSAKVSQAVGEVVKAHSSELVGNSSKYPRFQDVLGKTSQFAADVLVNAAKFIETFERKRGKAYRCIACKVAFTIMAEPVDTPACPICSHRAATIRVPHLG